VENEDKILLAATLACTYKPDYMTNDKIEAATKGHGSLVIPVFCAANSIGEDTFGSAQEPEMRLMSSKMMMVDAASPSIPLDMIIEKAIRNAKNAGADPSNAALIVASLAYFCGTCARAGVPMGNRKLGAMARMHSGATRTGAISLSTSKFTHRVPSFPAYLAIYEQLMDKNLTSVDGSKLPPFLAGGAIYGHSALGEDFNIPELAKNAAKVGTKAMMDSMSGAGITPYPLWPALIGATVTMELVHPDAFLGEEYGSFGVVDSAYVAGQGAADAAKLPKTLHIRGTKEEFNTARVIGDFGLILKDISGPSVIGSMALNEIFAGFEEAAIIGAGFSGGPVNPPLGHLCADVVPAMRLLMKHEGDIFKVAEDIRNYKMNSFIDPEMSFCALNTIARKAEEVSRGSISGACILASEPVRDRAIYRRIVRSYNMMNDGKSIGDVAKALDEERKSYVEERGSYILSGFTGRQIKLKFTELRPQARRSDKFTDKFWGFDSYISYDIEIDGKKLHIENLSAKTVPEFALQGVGMGDPDMETAIFAGAVMSQELQYIGHTVINITIPAAVGALMGMDEKTASKDAAKGAFLTNAIPGGRDNALKVVKVAKCIYNELNQPSEVLP